MAKKRSEQDILQEFRESISGVYQIKPQDGFLHVILKAANMDVKKGITLLKQYEDLKVRLTGMGELEFHNFKVSKEVSDDIVFKIIGSDCEGRNVVWAPVGRWEVKKMILKGLKNDVYKSLFNIVENFAQELFYRGKAVHGVVILDGKELTFKKINHLETIQTSIELAKIAELLFPLCDRVYILNAPSVCQYLLNICRPVVSSSNFAKLVILGSDKKKWLEAFKNQIPIEVVPAEYGGLGPKVLS